jgi:hypothetical protein
MANPASPWIMQPESGVARRSPSQPDDDEPITLRKPVPHRPAPAPQPEVVTLPSVRLPTVFMTRKRHAMVCAAWALAGFAFGVLAVLAFR